jgi:hypothetical protein
MRQGSSWLLGCGGRFRLLALAQAERCVPVARHYPAKSKI